MRNFLLALFLTLIATPALACSCSPWSGGLVSEFVGDYKSFWGVPVQSEVKAFSTDRPRLVVSYKVEVLEDFNRISQSKIEITSSIADGGSCGVQLTMGVPQFLSAYEYEKGEMSISSCTPYIPYKALKDYLETGNDVNIPSESICFDNKAEIKLENPDCIVWKDEAFSNWERQGQEDWLDYMRQWRSEKINR